MCESIYYLPKMTKTYISFHCNPISVDIYQEADISRRMSVGLCLYIGKTEERRNILVKAPLLTNLIVYYTILPIDKMRINKFIYNRTVN